MELDRNVSDYMQKRNVLATKVARILSVQMLLIAVFFCGMLLLKQKNSFDTDVALYSHVIIAFVVCVSFVMALWGSIALYRNRNIYKDIPDDIGLRQSQKIVECAYDVAKPALDFNMTFSAAMLAGGVLLSMICNMWIKGFISKIYAPKIILFATFALSVFFFLPSFDRMMCYKEIMSKHLTVYTSRSLVVRGISFFVLMSLSICTYLIWRYFGENYTIAWIVFCVAIVLYGAIVTLFE